MNRPAARNNNNVRKNSSLNNSRDSYTRVERVAEPRRLNEDIDEEHLEIPEDANDSNFSEGRYQVNDFNDPAVTRSNTKLKDGRQKVPLTRFLFIGLGVLLVIVVILAIVLPLTLIKKKEEAKIKPACPDGQNEPRIDCLFDRSNLAQSSNLEQVCKSRGCCWSGSPPSGGPNCAFPSNFGFRNYKVKENTNTRYWFELARLNSPESLAKSDISNLEARVEMHTDHRLRIKVSPAHRSQAIFTGRLIGGSFARFSREETSRTRSSDGTCRAV